MKSQMQDQYHVSRFMQRVYGFSRIKSMFPWTNLIFYLVSYTVSPLMWPPIRDLKNHCLLLTGFVIWSGHFISLGLFLFTSVKWGDMTSSCHIFYFYDSKFINYWKLGNSFKLKHLEVHKRQKWNIATFFQSPIICKY